MKISYRINLLIIISVTSLIIISLGSVSFKNEELKYYRLVEEIKTLQTHVLNALVHERNFENNFKNDHLIFSSLSKASKSLRKINASLLEKKAHHISEIEGIINSFNSSFTQLTTNSKRLIINKEKINSLASLYSHQHDQTTKEIASELGKSSLFNPTASKTMGNLKTFSLKAFTAINRIVLGVNKDLLLEGNLLIFFENYEIALRSLTTEESNLKIVIEPLNNPTLQKHSKVLTKVLSEIKVLIPELTEIYKKNQKISHDLQTNGKEIERITEFITNYSEKLREQKNQTASRFLFIGQGVIIFILLVGGGLISHSISRPLRILTALTDEMNPDNIDKLRETGAYEEQKLLKGRDEIAVYAQTFDQMRSAIVEKIELIEEYNRKLKENEEQYRAVADNIGDYIMRYDRNFRHTYANKKALEVTGLPAEEYIGKTHREMRFPEDLCKLWEENIQLVFDNGKQRNVEFDVKLANGAMSFELQLNPEFSEDGSIKTVIGISRDITNRKNIEYQNQKLQEQLYQAQKLESIGTLAGGIAHDFNNILYPIIGFTEISIEDLPKDHPVQENLDDVLKGAKRARDLVKQILSFSSQRDLEQKALPFQLLIEETLKLLRSIIPSNIEIQKEMIEEQIYIYANTTEIHEVIMNLCTNAFHAMEENGGILKVSMGKEEPGAEQNLPSGEYCCLGIHDTGSGISPEIIHDIFDPYFTTKKQGKGSGLGLSVIHGIINSYKGAIDVQSKVGKGTTMKVYLPLSVKEGSTDNDLKPQTTPTGNEKILFVDDEVSIVKLGTRLLQRLGYKVTGETSSKEALNLFNSNPDNFDLVITDMTMPLYLGTDLAKEILELRKDIPILLCTGFSERVDKETAQSLGIKGYINKPILLDELATKVRELLDNAKGE